MHFGIFVEERRRETSEATAFHEALELTEAAEAWGLDGVWLGEIHFNPTRSVQSAPIALASFMAARTRRVRIGTAVTVLPAGQPAAHRRGGGHRRPSQPGALRFRHRPQRLSARVRRARHPVRREPGALRGGAGDHQGGVEGRALQLRGQVLPVREHDGGAAAGPAAASAHADGGELPGDVPVGRPRSACRSSSASATSTSRSFGAHLDSYRAAWREAGHPGDGDVCLRIPVYAAPTAAGGASTSRTRTSRTSFAATPS